MKLQLFSYTLSGGIMVSIQLSGPHYHWDECDATLHEVKDWQQAVAIAQGIANVTGRQVRVTRVNNSHVTQEEVGRHNGHYFSPKTVPV